MTSQEIHPAERFFSTKHPMFAYLEIRFVEAAPGELIVDMEAPECFRASPNGEDVHSGMATLILDTALGGAVMGEMVRSMPIATAGLTAQHLRPPKVGERLRCHAYAHGVHNDIAHMSGRLIVRDSGEILATATGSFMLGTRAKPLGARL